MRYFLLTACLCWTLAAAHLSDNTLPSKQQEQYDRLANEFVAPCCWREPLARHRSPKADEARNELLQLVRAGHSDEEIRKSFVADYGEAILLIPPGGRAQWLFAAPILLTFVGFGLGAWFLAVALNRGRRRVPDRDLPSVNVDPRELEW